MKSHIPTMIGSLGLLYALGCGAPEDPEALPAEEDSSGVVAGVNGLKGEYFNNVDFTSQALQRVDATVNFAWGTGSPGSAIGPDTFSARWTGFVKASKSQTYTFYTSSDDGVRLWVNGQTIVNNWSAHALTENSGTIALQAGKAYPIIIDYFENSGSAAMKLQWSSASQAKQVIPQTQLFVTDPNAGTCAAGCSAPTPICGSDSKCTATRWVEPTSTLPDKWKSQIDTTVWTKWVRSVIPVVGQASTQNAALLEVAYYAEKIHMPQGQVIVPDLINSMLGAHPTRFSVYPACPNAWIHPNVQPPQSSGGGGTDETLVTEDWVLRYPKCTGQNAVACNMMKPGVLCNNCGWADASTPDTCRDTLAHEHGHTIDGHRTSYIDPNIDAIDKKIFPSNPTEGPAWSASAYFMNPSLETGTGRDRGQSIMSSAELNYWSVTQKFTMSKYPAKWGYVLKTTRCPQMGLTQPCPDTLTRTYAVPLDSSH